MDYINRCGIIGWCRLKYTPSKKKYDIGFRFYKEYWNVGYATEAAQACIEYGFGKLNLNKIIGRVRQENMASIRVLEKIGLHFSHYEKFDSENNIGLIYTIKRNK